MARSKGTGSSYSPPCSGQKQTRRRTIPGHPRKSRLLCPPRPTSAPIATITSATSRSSKRRDRFKYGWDQGKQRFRSSTGTATSSSTSRWEKWHPGPAAWLSASDRIGRPGPSLSTTSMFMARAPSDACRLQNDARWGITPERPWGNMQTDRIEPTPEMLAFYQRRTNEHIERVRRCMTLLAEVTDHREELLERAKVHDASKFGAEEHIPYVW